GGSKRDHEPWPQRGVRRVVRRHERPLVSRRTQRLGVLPDDEIELPAARCDRILAQGLQIRERERPGSRGWGEGGPRLRVDVATRGARGGGAVVALPGGLLLRPRRLSPAQEMSWRGCLHARGLHREGAAQNGGARRRTAELEAQERALSILL